MIEAPDEFLYGPRTYFTDIDAAQSHSGRKTETWEASISRAIKTLTISGKSVIIGASHLNSIAALSYFKKNPDLLKQGLVTVALRADLSDISDCITISGALGHEAKAFYRATINQCVRWSHAEGSSGLKQAILRAIRSPTSVIGVRLSNKQRKVLSTAIEGRQYLSRKDIVHCSEQLDPGKRIALKKYCNLAYRASGARVLSAELSIKNTEYLDYLQKDLQPNANVLPNDIIFWKLLVEQVFDALDAVPLSVNSLDALSWRDIEMISEAVASSNFVEAYTKLTTTAINALNVHVLDLNQESTNLAIHFAETSKAVNEVIKPHIDAFKLRRKSVTQRNVVKPSISFAVGLAGLVPVVGQAFGVIGAMQAGNELLVSLEKPCEGKSKSELRKRKMIELLKRCEIKDKSCLVDLVKLLTEAITSTHQL